MMSRFRRDQRGQWLTQTVTLDYVPKSVADVVVVNEGSGALSVDWVQFKNRPNYFSPVTAEPAHPDENGFIRRWMLLDPIKQEIRSNTIFTNSWLRDTFGKTYFKDQMTILPCDGQKVKATVTLSQLGNDFRMAAPNPQAKPKTQVETLKWHALDANFYNVKLFRFGEKYANHTYGSLFWAVTTIDSPEEMTNVRLAAGSNGASIWWLNGEEVLLLEGDRRMVVDDGMSPRITLKQGSNILRCAVINGPGLSDMCVRFLDEKGNPITNLEIK